jgi:uncharacterized protein (TIGR03435 family)
LNSARFDILAKIPDGAPRDQVPLMWQTLLVERFKLQIHRETKELPMYALVVGKNGPKMKESEIDPDAPIGGGPASSGPSASGGPRPLGDAAGGGFGGGGRVAMEKDGQSKFGPGGGRGPMIMINGRGHIAAKMMGMPGLVDLLARSVDRPVVDQTELKGTYDFNLDYTPDESARMPMPAGMPAPPPGGGGEMHGPENPDNGLSLFAALQAQLGLKLEAKKGPIELIVIDRVEKAPTEN